MITQNKLTRVLVILFVTALMAGCAAPKATLAPIPTLPPRPTIPTPAPPLQTVKPTGQPLQPTGQTEVFKFVRTIQIAPDANFEDAALGYIHYVPATDRFVVMLATQLTKSVSLTYPSQDCGGKAIGYKEYTTDMEPTDKYGFISCAAADATSQIIGNDVYLASMTAGPVTSGGKPEWIGWRLEKFDAVSWKRLASVDLPLDVPIEMDDGPTIALINGQITVSGEYFPDGTPDGPLGRGSHHHFFTTDLEPLGKKILVAPEYPSHCPEVSMIQEPGGDILMFASTAYVGDLIVLRFDKDWNFKEQKKLRDKAFFPTGSVTDGRLFYVAYTDTSHREGERMYRNVGFAAYDANWNTLQDVAVTDFAVTSESYIDGESPWVELHDNRLYVSYIASTLDPDTGRLVSGQAFVNVYELTP